MGQTELQEKYNVAVKEEDYMRLDVFAGTGSGLITKRQTAADILDEVENQVLREVKRINIKLSRL